MDETHFWKEETVMNITHRIEYSICIVALQGSFAMEGAHQVRAYLEPFMDDRNIEGIILNYSEVDFISSEGINVTGYVFNTLKDRGAKLALCGITPQNIEFFRMTGIDKVINIYKSEANALEAITQ